MSANSTDVNCLVWERGTAEKAVVGISTILYVGLLAFGIALVIKARYIQNWKKKNNKSRFFVAALMLLLLFAHIPWNVMNVVGTTADVYIWSFILNRTAVVAFFAGFTLLGVQWLSLAHDMRIGKKMNPRTFKYICFGVWGVFNLAMITYTIVLIAVVGTNAEGNRVYDVNILVTAAFQCLVATAFTIYGTVLFCVVRKAASDVGKPSKAKQIAIVNGLYALGFLTRGLAFLYRPITHCFMPYWAFWLMAYYLAELPPVLFQFIAFWRLAKLEAAERKQKRFWAAKPANSGHTARSAARPIAARAGTEDEDEDTFIPQSPSPLTSVGSYDTYSASSSYSSYGSVMNDSLKAPLLDEESTSQN